MENKNQKTTPPRVIIVQQQPEEYDEDEGVAPGWVWVIFFLLVLFALGTVILAGSPEILLQLESYLAQIFQYLK